MSLLLPRMQATGEDGKAQRDLAGTNGRGKMFIMCGGITVEGPMLTRSPCELADDANLPLKPGPAIIDSTLLLVLLKNGSLQNPLLQLRKSATGIFLSLLT
jgi:hypothetical protein